MINLTHHERHARLVKIVRKTYQADNPGSRLFPNTSGVAWRGNANDNYSNLVRVIELFNPRPVRFGIPEPDGKGGKSGGTDLLGETMISICKAVNSFTNIHVPILTGIECKTGKARLKKNQKVFRDWMKRINAIWFLARECTCHEYWIPVYRASKIIDWEIPDCELCGGKGYVLEDE